jgi:hypothetical protein
VAQWLACWAHNPKVRGSKPRSAILAGLKWHGSPAHTDSTGFGCDLRAPVAVSAFSARRQGLPARRLCRTLGATRGRPRLAAATLALGPSERRHAKARARRTSIGPACVWSSLWPRSCSHVSRSFERSSSSPKPPCKDCTAKMVWSAGCCSARAAGVVGSMPWRFMRPCFVASGVPLWPWEGICCWGRKGGRRAISNNFFLRKQRNTWKTSTFEPIVESNG